MKAAGQKLNFDTYGISLVAFAFLLGVAHIFTANLFIHFFNGIGIFLAMFLFSTPVFNEDKEWAFLQNVKNLFGQRFIEKTVFKISPYSSGGALRS